MAVASIVSFFTWSREKNGSAPTIKRPARSVARIMSRCIFGRAGFIRCIFPPEQKGNGGLPRADKRLAATHLVDAVIGSIIVTAAHLSLATGAGGDPGPRRIKVLGSCLRSSRFERRVRREFVVQRPRCQSHETIGAWIPVFCLIRIFENSGYRRFFNALNHPSLRL